MSASILPGKFGQGTVSVTLSKEEWEAFEDSAERMGKALVGSLRSILDEVHLVLDSNSAGSVRPGHGSPAAPPSPEEGEPEGGEDAAARLAAKRKADYSDFVNMMRDPRAAPLRNAAQAFCREFMEGPRHDAATSRDLVQAQLEHLEAKMGQHVLWAGLADDAKEAAADALERYITSRLHTRIFAPGFDARQHDADLRMRIAKLQFITPDHLDIPEEHRNLDAWARAAAALQTMAVRTTPVEKLDCILEASRHVYSAPQLNGAAPMSADDFLPVLVYIVLQANPPELQSNVDFISAFRARARMVGEPAYFFTHLAGAVYFIETLDASRLSIEPALFDKLMSAEDDNIYHFVSDPAQASPAAVLSPDPPPSISAPRAEPERSPADAGREEGQGAPAGGTGKSLSAAFTAPEWFNRGGAARVRAGRTRQTSAAREGPWARRAPPPAADKSPEAPAAPVGEGASPGGAAREAGLSFRDTVARSGLFQGGAPGRGAAAGQPAAGEAGGAPALEVAGQEQPRERAGGREGAGEGPVVRPGRVQSMVAKFGRTEPASGAAAAAPGSLGGSADEGPRPQRAAGGHREGGEGDWVDVGTARRAGARAEGGGALGAEAPAGALGEGWGANVGFFGEGGGGSGGAGGGGRADEPDGGGGLFGAGEAGDRAAGSGKRRSQLDMLGLLDSPEAGRDRAAAKTASVESLFGDEGEGLGWLAPASRARGSRANLFGDS